MRKVQRTGFALLIFFLIIIQSDLDGQDDYAPRFNASLIAGLNASQIDGDFVDGYNKLGLVAGLRAGVYLQEKTELGIELLYSQRGSRPELFPNNENFPFVFRINYVEVPVTFTFKDWLYESNDNEPFYRMHFYGGLSYGRLITADIEDDSPANVWQPLINDFSENDLSLLLGSTFFFNPNWGISIRWIRSLTLLYRNEPGNQNTNSLRHRLINFQLIYRI